MQRFLAFVKRNTLLYQSLLASLGDLSINFSNYLYHLLMANYLGPKGYGALASLISLTYWFGVPVTALRLVVVKYVSGFVSNSQEKSLVSYRHWITSKIIRTMVIPLIILLAVSFPISNFLHLGSFFLVAVMVADTFISIFLTLNTGFLQGLLKFGSVSLSTLVQAISKILLAVVLVKSGAGLFGASLAILISSLAATFFSGKLAGALMPETSDDVIVFDKREMFFFSLPTMLSIVSLNSLFTTDIVLARHFLAQEGSGYYASLALLAKIIFFVSSPISRVMFPMAAGKSNDYRHAHKLLIRSMGLTILICATVSFFYFLFPQTVVSALYGKTFLSAAKYLPRFAVFLSLYSLSSLAVNFFLSRKKYFPVYLSLAAAVIQPILILRFHDNIGSIVNASLASSLILLLAILLYCLKVPAQEK